MSRAARRRSVRAGRRADGCVASRSDSAEPPDDAPPPDNTGLQRVVTGAVPVAARLVDLLVPWDRARLRLTCRALAETVPAAACAVSFSAMVVRFGGAGLLRYGAGDARPCWAHVLVAVEADAADALRWLLGRFSVDHDRAWDLQCLALRTGSCAAWRIVKPLAPRATLDGAMRLAWQAVAGGSESLSAECAAAAAAKAEESPDALRPEFLCAVLYWTERRDLPAAVLVPFLRLCGTGRLAHDNVQRITLAALRMGRRDLAEPCDWQARFEPLSLLKDAVRVGDLALAEAALSALGETLTTDARLGVLCHAFRGTPATIEWTMRRLAIDAAYLEQELHRVLLAVLGWDAVDALRWLVEHTGHVPVATYMGVACANDAVGCIAYLAEKGVCPTWDMLYAALEQDVHRAACAVFSRLDRADVAAFVRVVKKLAAYKTSGVVRCAAMLRRHALLPAPGPAFLRACLDSLRGRWELGALVVAGYRIDADARTWLDSVRPHCAGTPRRVWRPLAHALYDRYRHQSL